jgi:hypothetical protein
VSNPFVLPDTPADDSYPGESILRRLFFALAALVTLFILSLIIWGCCKKTPTPQQKAMDVVYTVDRNTFLDGSLDTENDS